MKRAPTIPALVLGADGMRLAGSQVEVDALVGRPPHTSHTESLRHHEVLIGAYGLYLHC